MKKVFALLATVAFLASCAPTMEYTWDKEGAEAKKFNKIAIITVSKEYIVRRAAEMEIAKDFKKHGIETVMGTDLLPENATKADWAAEKMVKKLKELNVDGAIGVIAGKPRSTEMHVPGAVFDYPSPTYGYYDYWGYIFGAYNEVTSPSYTFDRQEMTVEATLYDLTVTDKKEAAIWKGGTTLSTTTPMKAGKGAELYARNLVDYLLQYKVIKK
ncbi:hypothetical protein [Sediminicola luteus]|nr:hypothetical protein [Sediminicola luteus]